MSLLASVSHYHVQIHGFLLFIFTIQKVKLVVNPEAANEIDAKLIGLCMNFLLLSILVPCVGWTFCYNDARAHKV